MIRAALISVALAGLVTQSAVPTPAEGAPVPLEARGTSLAQRTERTNRKIVTRAYAEWAEGGTHFFDILDEHVVWTILGPGPHAKTYTGKAAFLAGAVTPFGAQLSVPLRPTVRSIHADGDDVIILWDGVATRRDGAIYRNTYAWFFTMRGGRVVATKALLDLAAYDDVLTNVQPAPNR